MERRHSHVVVSKKVDRSPQFTLRLARCLASGAGLGLAAKRLFKAALRVRALSVEVCVFLALLVY